MCILHTGIPEQPQNDRRIVEGLHLIIAYPQLDVRSMVPHGPNRRSVGQRDDNDDGQDR